jgi:nicotinamide-nucleotide amidase
MVDFANLLLNLEQHSHSLCRLLADLMLQKKLYLATAESCTGGMIAAACTDLSGSSQWFERGFVTYSNSAKTQMLGVDADLIYEHGAVSEQVVKAMAAGAIAHSAAEVSIAVTGVAGPSGGSEEKPVGTVWIGWCVDGQTSTELCYFEGDRAIIRAMTVQRALQGLIERVKNN